MQSNIILKESTQSNIVLKEPKSIQRNSLVLVPVKSRVGTGVHSNLEEGLEEVLKDLLEVLNAAVCAVDVVEPGNLDQPANIV